MSCEAIDVKAYSFGEVTTVERREAELHIKSCENCRNELASLQLVQAALGGLREEEPPRRIAFVSDKVFEPNWWQRFWASGARVGFAGAGLLSTALLIHAFTRPPTIINQTPAAPTVAQFDQQDQQRRIDEAVSKAVAQIEERQALKVNQLLAATEKRYQLESRALAVYADENDLLRKQNQQMHIQRAGLVKD